MKSLSSQIDDLAYEIAGDQNHGEPFYDENDLFEFIGKLEKLKRLAFAYYEETKANGVK